MKVETHETDRKPSIEFTAKTDTEKKGAYIFIVYIDCIVSCAYFMSLTIYNILYI